MRSTSVTAIVIRLSRRLGIIIFVGGYFAGGLIKMAARRHVIEDDNDSIGAKLGAAVAA